MKCCPCCFGDRSLSRDIIPSKSSEIGTCSYCQTLEVTLIPPSELAELFAPLVSIYEPALGGKLLVEWMKEDWGMFSHPRMDVANAKSLLADVLDNGELVRKLFAPSPRYFSAGLASWEMLRDELMYTNRYFPDANLDKDRLTSLLAHLRSDAVPATWYRARIQRDDNPYGIEQMAAPPKRVTSHGRANPPGIPYLYLGSTEETAVSEVRPHAGEIIAIADFELKPELQLIDLRAPKTMVSPFFFGDEDQIGSIRSDLPFLERLGQELTRPVLPQGAAIDYVPSQYLCEFIKKAGYDGVIYRSSVSVGMNLALFNPANAVGKTVTQRNVLAVRVETGPNIIA